MSLDKLDEAGINPYSDVLTLEKYRELFGENKHEFTGVDYTLIFSATFSCVNPDCTRAFLVFSLFLYSDCSFR